VTGGGHGAAIQPPYDAVIFDMDGVVTDTARLHATAWKRLFDEVLADPRARTDPAVQPFDAVEDYRRYVDGRRREDGITAFLDARGVDIPPGSPEDPSGTWTVHGLAARKNDLFLELTSESGVQVFPGTAALLERLRAGGTLWVPNTRPVR
jgi:beta-phosphoglucomutase-like phosphatase (HAD superfamily)